MSQRRQGCMLLPHSCESMKLLWQVSGHWMSDIMKGGHCQVPKNGLVEDLSFYIPSTQYSHQQRSLKNELCRLALSSFSQLCGLAQVSPVLSSFHLDETQTRWLSASTCFDFLSERYRVKTSNYFYHL